MVRKVIIGLVIWLSFFDVVNSQTNSIQIEGLGNGILYSINYEHVFPLKTNALSMRLGGGYTPFDGSNFVTIPASVNYIIGRGPHKLELGVGSTYYDGKLYIVGDYEYYSSFGFFTNVYYRYDHPDKRIIFRAGLNPLISDELTSAIWIGVGFGVKIGRFNS